MVESTSQHLNLKDLVFLMHHFLTCNHNINSMSLKLSIHVDNTNNSSKNAVLKGKLFPCKKLIQEQKRLTNWPHQEPEANHSTRTWDVVKKKISRAEQGLSTCFLTLCTFLYSLQNNNVKAPNCECSGKETQVASYLSFHLELNDAHISYAEFDLWCFKRR